MRLTINTDGGSRGNPGNAAAGVVVVDEKNKKLFCGGFFIGQATNNVAEYQGLLRGLETAAQLGGTNLEIFCDSELIVHQVNGRYRVKNANLKNYHKRVVELMEQFDSVTVNHVLRENNTEPDEMVNRALDANADVGGECNQGQNTGDNETTTPPAMTVKYLPDMVAFDRNGLFRQVISKQQHRRDQRQELICLEAGKTAQIKIRYKQANIVVLQGKGTVKYASESHQLKAALWLGVTKISSLDITANPDGPLAMIVTWA